MRRKRSSRARRRRRDQRAVYRKRRFEPLRQYDSYIKHCILDNEKTVCPVCLNEQRTESGVFSRANLKWFRCSRCGYEERAFTWTEAQHLHGGKGIGGFPGRSKTGNMHEEAFDEHWAHSGNGPSYEERFGPLEPVKREDFESPPDRYHQTLKLYLEIKGKDCPWKYIERGGEVHINKDSVDFKADYQQKDRESNLYLFVEFLEKSPGWFCIPALDALEGSGGRTKRYAKGASGSGDEVYLVPLRLFKPLREAIEERAKELGLL